MSSEQPAGIVVLVYDVPLHETPTTPSLQHVALSIAAVSRLGPGKVIVDHLGPGAALVRVLGDLGVSVQALKKPLSGLADPDDMRLRLLNCRALLAQVESGLRDGKLSDEGFRKDLLFDIEALSERC
jgi:hypothetical protein